MGSNFKRLVRARMAETGKRWAAAVRDVREAGRARAEKCEVYQQTGGRWTCATSGLKSRCAACSSTDASPKNP